MEALFDGIPLDTVTTSMTINATAPIIFAMYLVMAEKLGISRNDLGGTLQNDMLKEFIAQREWICPVRPSVKMAVDVIEFCAKHVPKWHPISISGYHIREAGATAVQELAFTLRDGIEYVEECIKRGMNVDDFAPRLSFFFDIHNDFFEEIAKLRAARRMWAHIMKNRFGAKNEQSMKLKMHAQTAGVTLTAQQPMNNVARVAIQALAGILGGVQSLHTNSMDETLSLPTKEAVMVALRTQQIIAHESKIAELTDPLGGSYAVEKLTNDIESKAYDYIRKIDKMGGMMRAVDNGFPQLEISSAASAQQKEVESGKEKIVGVNICKSNDDITLSTQKIDEAVEEKQIARLLEIKSKRDEKEVQYRLDILRFLARSNANVMGAIVNAVREYATVGEISDVFREVYGVYRDPGYV